MCRCLQTNCGAISWCVVCWRAGDSCLVFVHVWEWVTCAHHVLHFVKKSFLRIGISMKCWKRNDPPDGSSTEHPWQQLRDCRGRTPPLQSSSTCIICALALRQRMAATAPAMLAMANSSASHGLPFWVWKLHGKQCYKACKCYDLVILF